MREDGHAIVNSTIFSLRFQFCEESLYVEEDVYDNVMGTVTHAIGMLPNSNNLGTFWLLKPRKYQLYGDSESVLAGSTKLLTPRTSSIVSVKALVLSKVKIEPCLETIFELRDDSYSDNFEVILPIKESSEKTMSHTEKIREGLVLPVKLCPSNPAASLL